MVRAVADEDAGWLGLSLLSGAHMTLVPRVLELLRQAGLADVGVLVGGIIPEEDVRKLIQLGVARVFGPGTALDEIAEFIRGQGTRGRAQPVAQLAQGDRRALSRLLTQAAQREGSETVRGDGERNHEVADPSAARRESSPSPAAAAWERAR